MRIALSGALAVVISSLLVVYSCACRDATLFTVALIIVTTLYVDYALFSRTLRKISRNLRVVRRIDKEVVTELEELEVELNVVNESNVPVYSLYIVDEPPPYTVRVKGSGEAELNIDPFSVAKLRYSIKPMCSGRVEFRGVRLIAYSPLRIFVYEWGVESRQSVVAVPRSARLEVLSKTLNSVAGVKLLGRTSGGLYDLVMIREYVAGDDPRKILWKHLARTGKILVRENRGEVQGRALVIALISRDDWCTGELPNTMGNIVLRLLESLLNEIRRSYGVADVVVSGELSARYITGIGRGGLAKLLELYSSISPFSGPSSPAEVVVRTLEFAGPPSSTVYGITIILASVDTMAKDKDMLLKLIMKEGLGVRMLVVTGPSGNIRFPSVFEQVGCITVFVPHKELMLRI
ncbi:MAG: hypothetical protein DRO12_06380 [Thermoprotei archaeon]|nr:MAG: hypothetical protein DRO12_06380 [Thermoprotei archaeon]